MLTSLFSVTGEFHRFLHRGRAFSLPSSSWFVEILPEVPVVTLRNAVVVVRLSTKPGFNVTRQSNVKGWNRSN